MSDYVEVQVLFHSIGASGRKGKRTGDFDRQPMTEERVRQQILQPHRVSDIVSVEVNQSNFTEEEEEEETKENERSCCFSQR